MSRSIRYRLYHVWINIKRRCYDKKCHNYNYYGGRGIKVCDEWLDFESFFDWAIEGYKEGLQIDRIDNNDDYFPRNCRWVTARENSNNRRNTPFFTINQVTYSLSDWCRIFNLNWMTVRHRLKKGLSIEDALELKTKNTQGIMTEINGEIHSLSEWCRIFDVPLTSVWIRIKNGMEAEEALKFKKMRRGKKIAINGENHTLKEWSEICNEKYDTVWHRINRGMRPIEALGLSVTNGK
jgi:hypothetical protein